MTELKQLIAPSFYKLFHEVTEQKYTHYWLKGGRGSTKSSFVSLMIILGMVSDPDANAVAVRKVGEYLRDSVFAQLLWAIEKLEMTHLWKEKASPLELIFLPTGQRILFRGADKPQKLKSTKVKKGYIKYIWYEEPTEMNGMEEIRTINQSLMRGGEHFTVFYSYNPPKSKGNWINKEVLEEADGKKVHHSTYLKVPCEWLGDTFIREAQRLKETKPAEYLHEYMGEVTGTGGEVFENVQLKGISDGEICAFDRVRRGIDFGYAADPFVYVAAHYDKKRKRLFIFDEIYKKGLSNAKAAELIPERGRYGGYIVCDSAEPKSIAELRGYGLYVKGAKKGPDSVEYGIKFLQSLEEIVIDPERCPETAREFYNYELIPDGNDGFRDGYPDRNNHSIDAVRYAMEDEMRDTKARVISRREFFN